MSGLGSPSSLFSLARNSTASSISHLRKKHRKLLKEAEEEEEEDDTTHIENVEVLLEPCSLSHERIEYLELLGAGGGTTSYHSADSRIDR